MPLTSASLSLLQKRHRKRGFDHVASYVAEQAAYPPEQSGDENVEADNPASPRKSSTFLLGEEAAGLSRSAARSRIQPKGTWSKCDGESDESPEPALTLDAKRVSRKRQRYDSSLISPIKENNAEDGIRYGSETTFASWSTSPARKPAETSQRTAAREEVFEKRKRHKMHESRQKPAIEKPKRKKEKEKMNKAKEPRLPQPAFGVLASSAVESEHLSGARLTVRPQIATGLFHKGKVSGLRSRAALPDLTFCEMDFLRHGTSECRPIQDDGEARKDKGKKRGDRGTNEEISSFFKRATSPPGKENKNALPNQAKRHVALPKVPGKADQADTQIGRYETVSRRIPLSLGSQSNDTQHPLERTLLHVSPRPLNSPQQSKTSASTPNYLVPHRERSIFRSLSVNSSGGPHSCHPQTIPSEMSNPVVTWLRRTTREYPKNMEDGFRDKCSYPGSSIREFNELSGVPSPPSPRRFLGPPKAQGNMENDEYVEDRWGINSESVMTGGANMQSTNSQTETAILRWKSDVVQEPRRHFGPYDEIFGRPVHSLQETGARFGMPTGGSLDPQPPAGGFEPNFFLDAVPQAMQNSGEVPSNDLGHYQTDIYDFPISRNGYANNPDYLERSSLSNDRGREAGATSPYFNNRDLVVEESEYPVTHDPRLEGRIVDGYEAYTDLDANLDNEIPGYEADETFNGGNKYMGFGAERYRIHQPPQNTTGQLPRLGPRNFWRPHRLY
ncbi:hypothetical protein TWF281_003369 [Arthrobotrys megalospora]